jgi:protoporphyrinogen/coproporphyrinogen III oxidase
VAHEQRYGSVMRGMLAQRFGKRADAPRAGQRRCITFRGGLGELAGAIGEALGGRLLLETPVREIREPGRQGLCEISTADGVQLTCEHVVIATEHVAAARLISRIPRLAALSPSLEAIPCAGLAVIGVLLKRGDVAHPLDGFGYLNRPRDSQEPGRRPRMTLGCMFRSTIFPHTAPPDTALVVMFAGGMLYPACATMDERALLAMARHEMRERLGVPEHAPLLDSFIRRWPGAIPQFHIGHSALRGRIGELTAGGPVSVIGNVMSGLSLPDCIAGARAHAESLIEAARGHGGSTGSNRLEGATCAPASF